LFKLGRDVSIAEYKKMPHGFLNFDIFPFIAEDCNKAIKHSSMWFKLEMTKQNSQDDFFGDDGETNHVLYNNTKLHNEEQIIEKVGSDTPLWYRALNQISLPLLKILF